MNIMNLIHDICITKNKINNTPRWRFIALNKQTKKLNNDIEDLLSLDIFSLSDHIISFLNCFSDDILENNITGYLQHSNTFIHLMITDDNNLSNNVLYLPTSNRFEINNMNIGYTIYRNTKISNKINKVWEPLSIKIKQRYLEIVIELAEYISLSNIKTK